VLIGLLKCGQTGIGQLYGQTNTNNLHVSIICLQLATWIRSVTVIVLVILSVTLGYKYTSARNFDQ